MANPTPRDRARRVASRDSPDIAEALGISMQALRYHLHHINQKFWTLDQLEAVMDRHSAKMIE